MKKFFSVYTLLMNTIYLSHRTEVAEGTSLRTHTVPPLALSRLWRKVLNWLTRRFEERVELRFRGELGGDSSSN